MTSAADQGRMYGVGEITMLGSLKRFQKCSLHSSSGSVLTQARRKTSMTLVGSWRAKPTAVSRMERFVNAPQSCMCFVERPFSAQVVSIDSDPSLYFVSAKCLRRWRRKALDVNCCHVHNYQSGRGGFDHSSPPGTWGCFCCLKVKSSNAVT